MDGYFVHIKDSTVRVGLLVRGKDPRYFQEELLPTTLVNSRIIDPRQFADQIGKSLSENFGKDLPKLPIYYILEPEITDLFLLTLDKGTEQSEEKVLAQIKEKLIHEDIQNLYYTYFRIAPFIFQFSAIQKTTVENFLESSNILGLPTAGLFPLGLLLPKTNTDIASIFVIPSETNTTVVFSELTGTSFCEKVEKIVSFSELSKLFFDLSVYNKRRYEPLVYSFKKFVHKVSTEIPNIRQIEYPLATLSIKEGVEEIDMANSLIDSDPSIILSQINVLNILPLPQKQVKSLPAPVYAVAGVLSVSLVFLLVMHFTGGLSNIFQAKNEVLAEQTNQIESEVEDKTNKTEEPEKPAVEVKRTDIKIRVENGNGIPGSAGKLKEYLEGFGYTVVSVGNSPNTDYQKTTVAITSEFTPYKDILTNDLKTNYDVQITDSVEKHSDYDVLVIAGAK